MRRGWSRGVLSVRVLYANHWRSVRIQRADQDRVVNGEFRESRRDFTKWLNSRAPCAKVQSQIRKNKFRF